jgi:hypothetical protein
MESSKKDNHENIKLLNDVLLAEYNMLRDAVLGFRQMQGQLDNLALTALGLSIPLILVILEQSLDAIGIILFLPMLFFAIAFVQLRHERQINLDSTYVDANLRPRINELLSKVLTQEVSVLEYEKFLAAHYFAPNLLTQWVITTSRGGISLAVGLGLIVMCLYLQLIMFKLSWNAYETWLMIINFTMLVVNVALAFPTARMQYRFYTKQPK